MLSEIRISNMGVIADASLDLSEGFTAVTGETGAGKTMIFAGLGLLCGSKADPSRVRPGAEKSIVEGRLHPPGDPELLHSLSALDAATDDDGSVILSRTVYAQGRSRAHVGGRSAPVTFLAEVGERCVAVHGQSDQMRLLRPAEQRLALDRFGGEPLAEAARRHRAAYIEWRAALTELAERRAQAEELHSEVESLRQGVVEIEKVAPESGEEERLREEAIRLENAEALCSAAHTAHHLLAGDPSEAVEAGNVSGLLASARKALSDQAHHDAVLADYERRADEVALLASELAADLASYMESTDSDPARLAQVQERRATLAQLTRMYGGDVDAVLAWAAEAQEKLLALDTSEDTISALERRSSELESAVAESAQKLSEARYEAAQRFSDAVTTELTGLAMPHARVVANVTRREISEDSDTVDSVVTVDGRPLAVSGDGIDDVELCLIAHPGAPPLPLQRGASGGELSRVMLAIEVVFAGVAGHATMVFDEVDAGVGGKAAVEIGRRLATLARTHQVVVVTHLPQVAAFADHHLVVTKDDAGAVTTSGIRPVVGEERARELARMLAGIDESDTGLAHANELLALAQNRPA